MERETPSRAVKWVKRVLLGLLVLVVACCAGFVAYASNPYEADDLALATIAAGEGEGALIPFAQTDSEIAVGDPAAEYGLVLYPGAKVDPRAYVPLAYEFAKRGVFCVVAKMPLNFAFFDMGAASRIIDEYPQVGSWWVGGHSLGGAMAAQWASDNADKVAGVALLASYAACDLSQTGLRAVVVYGSEDGVLNRQKLEECAANLPADAQTLVIEGGNHAGFGDYGQQAGDGTSRVSDLGQQSKAADAIVAAMAA